MVSPKKVTSPKEKLELLHVIEDGTKTGKGYSIAQKHMAYGMMVITKKIKAFLLQEEGIKLHGSSCLKQWRIPI